MRLQVIRTTAFYLLLAGFGVDAGATTVTYGLANVAGNSWTATYLVSNDTLGSAIEEFTLYFDPALYANLGITASPASWDALVIQPDPGIPADGFADALALGPGLAPGGTLTGLAVSFSYLGAGTPGPQPFDVVDPLTFSTLDAGVTAAAVPLPAAGWLLATGAALLAFRIPKQRRL